MTPHLAAIWRHPVKSLGAEALPSAVLEPDRPLVHDRVWAIAHGASSWDADLQDWAAPNNFLRVTHVPELARVRAAYDATAGRVTLTHPDRPAITLIPGEEPAALTGWVAPLAAGRRPGPYRLAEARGKALTDVPEPWVSVLSLASLRALGQGLGTLLDPIRFRGNLWLDGLAPWEERDWVGREIAIGGAILRIEEPIGRCRATEANPATGRYDLPTVAALDEATGTTEFGLYARVIRGAGVAPGAPAGLA